MRLEILTVCVVGALSVASPAVAQPGGDEPLDMEAMSKKLDNPLSDLWLLFLQNDTQTFRGNPVDGSKTFNTTYFMPVLSVPLGDNWNLVNRPVLNFISAPKPQLGAVPNRLGGFPSQLPTTPAYNAIKNFAVSSDREFEFGDMIWMSTFSPVKPWRDKLIWGVGPTFMFPTASDDFFSSQRYSAGPALIAVWMGEKFKIGTIAQHWWDFAASNGSAPDVSFSNIQYLAYYQLPGLWQIGAGPNVLINWEAGSGNKVTFPVGIGVNKTLLVGGKLPMRIGFEVHYAAIRPDDFGQRFTFRFYLVPVVPNLVKRAMQN